MRYLWICVLLALPQLMPRVAAGADVTVQPLASITNDRNPRMQRLGVLLDAGKVVGLRFDTINGNNPHKRDFSIDDVKEGAILEGDARHKSIVLHGSIDSTMGSTELIITYVSNVVFGEHKHCRVSLMRDKSGQWHIVNNYEHKPVDHLFVKTRVFGISTIEGVCPR